jgi:chorismate synthase
MSSIWGNNIKISIFGESHGPAIGVNIDGLPPGIELDMEDIKLEMRRRAPNKNKISTTRREKDEFEILSGFFNNKTTGTPLCMVIRNIDSKSKNYEKIKNLARPGHADFTGNIRYLGHNDYRGGGHFSGRLTAPLVFAGAIAKQILRKVDMVVGSHIKSVHHVEEDCFSEATLLPEVLEELRNKDFPTLNKEKSFEMEKEILLAKEEGDSVGGIVEVAILNPSPGLGNPFFDSVESRISSMMFSIPGVKAIEFGKGFNISRMKGSDANDEPYIDENKVKSYTNNNGGIVGGITSGMAIVFKVGFKPTPSISKLQRTIDMEKNENTEIRIIGRHDPCIVVRAIPVVEAATALVMLDLLMEMNMNHGGFKRI